MKSRVITLLLAAGLVAVVALTAVTFPAAAQTQTVYVQLPSGEVVPVTVDVPPGSSLDDIQLPGTPVPAPTVPEHHAHHSDHSVGPEAAPYDAAGARPPGRQRPELGRRIASGGVELWTPRPGEERPEPRPRRQGQVSS